MREPIAKVNLMRYGWAGILDWHRAGYTGKGIKICVIDADTNTRLVRYPERVTNLAQSGNLKDWTKDYGFHGLATIDIIQQILPDANIVFASWVYPLNHIVEWCIGHNVDIITASLSYSHNTLSRDISEKAVEAGIKMVSSAGNDGAVPVNLKGYPARKKSWVAVGAAVIDDFGMTPRRMSYSSIGEDLEVMGMTHLIVQMPEPFYEMVYTGTSCASPVIASMVGMIQQKEGSLSKDQFRELLMNHCVDMYDEGRDKYTGWGMLRMPALKNDRMKEIVLHVDSQEVRVDGILDSVDQPPFIVKETGRTVVPLSFIGRMLGCHVEWDNKNRRVIIRG